MRARTLTAVIVAVLLSAAPAFAEYDYTLKLRAGEFVPSTMRSSASAASSALKNQHVFIQFDEPLTQADQDRLALEGIVLLNYVPNLAYTARLETSVDQSTVDRFGIRWLGEIKPDQKIAPDIADYGYFDWARRGEDLVQYVVVLHADQDAAAWRQRLIDTYDAEIIGHEPSMNAFDLIMPEQALNLLSAEDGVMWIEQARPFPEEHNNDARLNLGTETIQAAPWNLSGNGVTVAEWDGGAADQYHEDFNGRVQSMDFAEVATHATHVAGTVMGSGSASNGTYRGMAPQALLKSWLWWSSGSEASNEYATAISQGARIATNSWGYGVGDPATQAACEATLGNYWTVCGTIDNIVRGSSGAPISITWSAGNQRGSSSKYCGSIGWVWNTVTTLPTSKNVIAVGAINSNDDSMTGFSSFGPTDDGRIKPDVVGPGCQTNYDHGITSVRPTSGYTTMCGTSMSSPAVAGTIALLLEQWDIMVGGDTLLPSTVKGILINTAQDLGPVGPDFAYGHGKVDAVAAATKIGIGAPSFVQGEVSTGDSHVYDLTVGNVDKLKVTLVWDDPGGTVSATQHLINDLDLKLIDPFSNEELPWVLDPNSPLTEATTGEDHVNNVETVEIDAPQAGLWKAQVSGFNIPNGPQKYSLIFSPDSIHTPGNSAALAIFDNGTLEEQPGQTAAVEFWVTNVGINTDSVTVDISDDAGWLQQTVTDSVVELSQWDSAHFVLSANVPSAALAGEFDQVTCDAVSLSDGFVKASRKQSVTAGAYYIVDLAVPVEDTVLSPDTVMLTFSVKNNGNDTDLVTITPMNDSGWIMSPTYDMVQLDPGDSTTVSFQVYVPAEIPDLAVNPVSVDASSDGGANDAETINLISSNPYFPPALVAPASPSYLQERSPAFTWDSEGDTYTLYIATDELITNRLRTYTGISQTNFTMPPGDSLPDGEYFWAVRRFVGSDSSSLQRYSGQFLVDNIPPPNILPVSPVNKYIKEKDFTFQFKRQTISSWVLSPEVNLVEFSADSTFATGVSTYGPTPWLIWEMQDIVPDGRWYWRTYGIDSAGNVSDTSATATFLLDTEPPVLPEPLVPADGSTLMPDTLLFTWTTAPPSAAETSPEYFYVHVSDTSNFSDYTYTGFVYDDTLRVPGTRFTENQTYYWRVKALDSAGLFTDYSSPFTFRYSAWICGDVNGSSSVPDISDLTILVNNLFVTFEPLPTPEAADMNCDSTVDLSDLTTLVNYLFVDGPDLNCCQ